MNFLEKIKEHAEVSWFIVMLIIIAVFVGWNIAGVTSGSSTSFRYGLPLKSGLPENAQKAVDEYQSRPDSSQEVVNGVLVVNMSVTFKGFSPDVIVANSSEPVVVILKSPQVISGFFMRFQDGVVNVNIVPGYTSYVYFVTPSQPGNYTWRDPEYSGYNFSYWTGTLEVK
ncbi:proton pump complex quinol oxidase subunit SoxA [Sulfuracidifex metallicus]|uniref:proton pump complex quinol oxidase subunit SoxA n=1 Tax=Sulfuracidifex metallicus TaxID=47303 RepID=UPI002272D252|nr:proton pump complex quinol oxidase subunit SoxA [Sulfuracidifex metallicus]MCY0850979.1 proton pump complex quinol oxidase subunit SoxA [Sulfuracidifex metallicus]